MGQRQLGMLEEDLVIWEGRASRGTKKGQEGLTC